MKSYSFLFWAYNVVWIGIAAYVVFLFIRLRRVDRRIERIERRLSASADQNSSSS